jgi:hypothetical protein
VDVFWLVGQWETKRRVCAIGASGTVRHKKESGCIFGWWDSEAQKGEWVYFWLVGHRKRKSGRADIFLSLLDIGTQNRRVAAFWASGTVRHRKESGCIFSQWDSETHKKGWLCILHLVGQWNTKLWVATYFSLVFGTLGPLLSWFISAITRVVSFAVAPVVGVALT